VKRSRGRTRVVITKSEPAPVAKRFTVDTPPPQASDVYANRFHELSDEGFDLVGQVLKAIVASRQPVIDAQKQVEGRRS
jgi:hypothetical protein